MTLQGAADRAFLALMMWREARGESREARCAVGYTVVERIKSGVRWWGTDVLGVLGCEFQYSSMTAHGDPQLTTWPKSGDAYWQICLELADMILSGQIANQAPGADSYYDRSLDSRPPEWAASARHVADIGRLRFFRVAT